MAGINFEITLDDSPFNRTLLNIRKGIKEVFDYVDKSGLSTEQVLSNLKNMSAQVERAGSSMESVMKSVFDGDKLSHGMESFFDGIVKKFGLGEKAAEDFKEKATAVVKEIAGGSDDAATKFARITSEIANLVSEVRQSDVTILTDDGSGRKNLEEMRVSANSLIEKFNDLYDISEGLEQKLSDNKGMGFDEIRQSVEEYGKSMQDASDAATEAIGSQEAYIQGLHGELDKLTDSVNATSDKSILADLNKQAEELTVDLGNANAVLGMLKNAKEGIEVKIADFQEVKETVDAFGELNKRLQQYGTIIGEVKMGTEEANKAFEEYANKTQSASDGIKGSLKGIATLAGIAFGIHEIKNFIERVAETRAYFQDIESSMKTFLGSSERAADFTKKLKDYTWYNMYEFDELANASKQMIAFKNDVDTVIPKLDMLSNVAAGTHTPLMELVNAYNKAKAEGVVDGQGIQSWASKGVVIRDVLKEMGDEAIGTQVTFEQLNKVLEHLTGDGGMFHNLMGEQLNNISAEKGQLEDNLSNMFNEIGEKYQDAIAKWYKLQADMVSNYQDIVGGDSVIDFTVNVAETGMDLLMEHWRDLMDVIKNAIAIYGSWRVALAATSAVHGLQVQLWKAEALAANINSGAIASNTIVKGQATTATVLLDKATKAFNASLLASPWTWVTVAIAGAIYGIYKLATAETTAEAGLRKANDALKEQTDLLNERKDNIGNLISTIRDENETEYARIEAYKKLKAVAPEITEEYSRQKIEAMELDEVQKLLNKDLSDMKYEQAKKNVDEYTQKIQGLKKNIEDYFNSPMAQTGDRYGTVISTYRKELEDAESQLRVFQKELANIENIRREANTPIEVKIQEAETNANEKQIILDFYDEAMRLAQAVADADNNLAVGIEQNGKTNHDIAVEQFDDFIAKVEADLKDPLTLKYGNDKEETARFLEELKGLKAQWSSVFDVPIPVWFSIKFSEAKKAVDDALGNAPEGYHWVSDMVTNAGRHLEKDAQQVVKRTYEVIKKERDQLDSQLKGLDLSNADDRRAATGLKQRISSLDKEMKGYSVSDRSKKNTDPFKLDNERMRQQREQAQHEKELELSTRQAQISMMKEGSEKTLAQMKLDFDRRANEIEKGYEELRQKKIDAEKRLWEANPANAGKPFDPKKVDVTPTVAEQQNYDVTIQANIAEYQKKIEELSKQELQYMYDFLSEYGTMEQKRYAIIKQYDEKIANETSENKRKMLEQERESALAQIDAKYLAMDIDWGQSFSGIGEVLQDIAKETLTKVNAYMKSDDFKKLDASDKQAYLDLRTKLLEAGGSGSSSPFKTSTWAEISRLTTEYNDNVRAFITAQEAHRNAVNQLIKAEEELKKATTPAAKAMAQIKVDEAQKNVTTTAQAVNTTQQKKDESQQDLHDATDAATQGLNDFSTILGQITSGTLSGFATGVANLINSISGSGKKAAASLGELGGKAGGLIGAILQIIDALGDDPNKFISDILGKIATVIETILTQLPQIIVTVIQGVGNIVGGVVKGVANLFSGGSAFGSNKEEMEERITELATANQSLQKSIDELSDTIARSDSTNKESIDAYKRALQAEREWEKNQREAIDARASEWSNSGHGFLGLGGEHSFNYYLPDSNWNGWKTFSKVLRENGYDTSVNRDNLWHLTPGEMKVMRDFAPAEWAALMNGSGESNPKELIDAYIERAGQMEELTSALNEKLTGYSWEGFLDSYKSLLKDLTSDTKTFADKIESLISNALLESLVNEEFRGRIKSLYNTISQYAEDGLDSAEIDEIRRINEGIAEDMLKKRQAFIDAGLITVPEDSSSSSSRDQSAFVRASQNITIDQANAIEGRMTAIQIALEQQKMNQESSLANILTATTTNSTYLSNIVTAFDFANNYLLDIRDFMKSIKSSVDDIKEDTYHLSKIEDKL